MRQAILKAADQIERHPKTFDFNATAAPDCGTPGCALGWIGVLSGKRMQRAGISGVGLHDVAALLGFFHKNNVPCASPFYDWMSDHVGYEWKYDAAICAKGLRLLADERFPAKPKYTGIPADIKAIFNTEQYA